jgi:hypothetical protein
MPIFISVIHFKYFPLELVGSDETIAFRKKDHRAIYISTFNIQ